MNATVEADIHHRERPFSLYGASAPNWQIWLGAIVTALWLTLLSVYVSATIGWVNISSAPMDILGTFLEGAFAPLAFLWLVIGYFLQQKELAQTTAAIKMQYIEIQRTAVQAEIQSEAIKASEQHARRESFLRVSETVRQQLGAIMGFLYLSSQGATGSGIVSQERIASLWSQLGRDPDIFSRSLFELRYLHGENYAYKLFYGTPTRTRHSENFVFNFERMLNAAEQCDDDGMIKDALLGSVHGFLYGFMRDFKSNPPPGFSYGNYNFDPDSH